MSSYYKGKLLSAPRDILSAPQARSYNAISRRLRKCKKFSPRTRGANRRAIIADLAYRIAAYPFGPTAKKYARLLKLTATHGSR